MTSFKDAYTHTFRANEKVVKEIQAVAKKTPKGTPYIDVPYVKATPENTKGFGYFIDDFEGKKLDLVQWPSPNGREVLGGKGAGETQASPFKCEWREDNSHIDVINVSTGHAYDCGWREDGAIFTTDANTHPDGEQAFTSADGRPFILLFSNNPNEASVKPTDFVAFYFDAKRPFVLTTRTYHMAAFPVFDNDITLITKQGMVHGNVVTAFYLEFGVYIRIPNAFREPTETEIPAGLNYPPAPRATKPIPSLPESFPTTLKVQKATESNISPYGCLVKAPSIETSVQVEPWPAQLRPVAFGADQGAGVVSYTLKWEVNHLKRDGQCAGVTKIHTGYRVKKLYARPDGELLLFPSSRGDWFIVLALPNQEQDPDKSTLKAFRVQEGYGIKLKSIGWHSEATPIDIKEPMEMQQKSSKVDACLVIDIEDECKGVINVQV